MQTTTSWAGYAPPRGRTRPPAPVTAAMALMLTLGALMLAAAAIFAFGVATAGTLRPVDVLTLFAALAIGGPLVGLAVPVYRGSAAAQVGALVVGGFALVGSVFLFLLAVVALPQAGGGPGVRSVALVLTALVVLFGQCSSLIGLLLVRSARRYFRP